jgi:hypothetical protein
MLRSNANKDRPDRDDRPGCNESYWIATTQAQCVASDNPRLAK